MIGNELLNIIKILIKVCRKTNTRIVFMGGISISFYARPRATYDVDGIINVDKADLDKFLGAIDKAGFRYDKKKPVKFIQSLPFITLFHKKYGLYVDLFIAENKFQKEIIGRAKKIKFGSIKADIISPEDLILLKLQTARERDTEDVRNVIYENFKVLDYRYLRKWAKRLGVEIFLDDEIKSVRPL